MFSLTSFYGQNHKVIVPTNPACSDDDQELDLSADDDADPDFEAVLFQDSSSEDELRPSHQFKRQKASSQTRNRAVAGVENDSGEDGSDQENTTSASSPSWEKNDINPPPLPEKPYPKPDHISAPYEYFLNLFPLEVIDHIVYQTNLYVKQKDINTSYATSMAEIMNFIGILLYMGVVELPSLEDYWTNETRIPQVANVMSSKQFQYLRRHAHFNDNEFADESDDRFYKIRPMFNFIRKTFQQVPPSTKQSIDEVMK